MRNLIVGSLLAAVAMFIFGAVYWNSPAVGAGARDVADDAAAQAMLKSTFPETGLYWVPGLALMAEDADRFNALHEAGPVAMVNIRHQSGPAASPGTFAAGLLHEWAVCFLIGLLLMKVSPSLPGYGDRVRFVTAAGVVMAVFVNIGAVIWWRMPMAFQFAEGIYNVIAWFLAGMVLARFVPGRVATPR
jgi:hypothetical protein